MRLHKAQALFARTMLDGPAALSAPDLGALFTGTPDSVPERLGIYRNTILTVLTRTLESAYPQSAALTGEAFARTLMTAYAQAHPPREACLAAYGAGLEAFIAGWEPARSLPYLPAVARLDWALHESAQAADDAPLSPAGLQSAMAAEAADTRLRLRACVRLLDSRWPLPAIRDFCLRTDRGPDETLDLDAGGCRLMTIRPALSAEIVSLDAGPYGFLTAIAQGKTLGEAVEAACETDPAFDVQAVLQTHLAAGTFAEGHTEEATLRPI